MKKRNNFFVRIFQKEMLRKVRFVYNFLELCGKFDLYHYLVHSYLNGWRKFMKNGWEEVLEKATKILLEIY